MTADFAKNTVCVAQFAKMRSVHLRLKLRFGKNFMAVHPLNYSVTVTS